MTRPPQSCIFAWAVIVIIIKAIRAVNLKTIFFILLLFYLFTFVTLFVVLDVGKLQIVAEIFVFYTHTAQEIVGNDVEAGNTLAYYSRCMAAYSSNSRAMQLVMRHSHDAIPVSRSNISKLKELLE